MRNPLLRNRHAGFPRCERSFAKGSSIDSENFISVTPALTGIRNFRRQHWNGDILTFTPSRITALLLSIERKVDVIDGVEAISQFPRAVAHVPRLLWRSSAPRFWAHYETAAAAATRVITASRGRVTFITIQFRPVNSIGSRSADQ